MEKGKIEVSTENIFPIIKKFLYSDHEIFLRELISNAIDATKKLNTLVSLGKFKGNVGDLKIEVTLDKDAKTLTVTDSGIGMTADEVKKYITQIAFSSAEEFIKKYQNKGKDGEIIGHFGMGFYSSFMVSDKVEIKTKSYQKGNAVIWSCDGSPNYTIGKGDRKKRGTSVVMHINDESSEFLETERIQQLLVKYCKFLPIEIYFDGAVINNTKPAWMKKPSNLTSKHYLDFYKELYPVSDDPLFWVHLNVDYPFRLTGILYFPKFKAEIELQKNKIQLYSNQVFVTDSVENIVPEFLMLLHGVLDSPDIPLNVSRSFLQNDPNVRKINSHITKKVADKLEQLYKKDKKTFQEKWDDIQIFIKYGMLSDEKFYDRATKFFLFRNTESEYYNIEEYLKKIKPLQTDKDDKTVILYTNNQQQQDAFIQTARRKKYDVLELNETIDPHFISLLESKLENVRLVRVDADIIDKLIDKDKKKVSKLGEAEQEKLKPLIEKQIKNSEVNIVFESLAASDHPMTITKPEFTRRMKDMAAAGGPDYMGDLPDQFNLVVNSNSPIITKIMLEPAKEKQGILIKQLYDLALISQNMLKGKELTDFIKRSMDLIEE